VESSPLYSQARLYVSATHGGKHAIVDSSLFPSEQERGKGHGVYSGLEINELDKKMS